MEEKYSDYIDIKNEEILSEILSRLPDYCRLYFRYLKTKNRSSRTISQYARDIERFYRYLWSQPGFKNTDIKTSSIKSLDNLSREDFLDYFDTLTFYSQNGKKKKSRPETLARKMSSLKSFFSFYHKDGMIEHNYAEVIDSPNIPRHEIIVIEQDELERFFHAIEDRSGMNNNELQKHLKVEKRDLAIITLLLGTGIRVSELVGLNLKDIDFYNTKMLVKRKGGDYDEVYFSQEVEKAVKDYLENGRDALLSDNNQPALFVSLQHSRLTDRAIQLMIKKYALKAGIPVEKAISPHKFRKTYGSYIYNQTGDIELVAQALHHKSIATTKAHYAKSTEEHKRIAAATAAELLKKEN